MDRAKRKTKEYYEKAPDSYVENLRDKVRAESQQKIDEANALTTVQKHPAYMSVAIYFHSIPDSGLLAVMKERAQNVASAGVGLRGYEQPVRIEGFRFLEQRTTFREVNNHPS